MGDSGWADHAQLTTRMQELTGFEFGSFKDHAPTALGLGTISFIGENGGRVERVYKVLWQEYHGVRLDWGMESEERIQMLGEPVEQDTYVYPDSADYVIEFMNWEQLRSLELTGHVAAWAKTGDGYIVEYWRL